MVPPIHKLLARAHIFEEFTAPYTGASLCGIDGINSVTLLPISYYAWTDCEDCRDIVEDMSFDELQQKALAQRAIR